MQQREQIFQSTEQKCRSLNEKFNSLIVKEIEARHDIKLNLREDSEPIIDLLFTPLRDDVIELLHKYSCQKPEILLALLSNFCNHDKYAEGMYIYLISRFTKVKSYKKDGILHTLDTDMGHIAFHKFHHLLHDPHLVELITNGECVNRCHTVVGVFANMIDSSNIITSLLPGRYGGEYFHSYFHNDEDLIIDMANNIITPKQDFDTLFKPKEIITYPSIELEERYQSIKEKSTDSKALQIALEHMKHK